MMSIKHFVAYLSMFHDVIDERFGHEYSAQFIISRGDELSIPLEVKCFELLVIDVTVRRSSPT